ncbi:MAG: IPT/TIG domain-containing protein [Steroidobacteraceae bacterium]
MNLNETALNVSNVRPAQFGKLFTRTVDGQIYAQPLYVAGLNLGTTVRNVVYIATEKNNVYAFDADDPNASAPLWQVNLGPPVPVADTGEIYDINEFVGITSTPVIDPVTGTLYCVAKTKEGGSYFQRLHALDIRTGQEKFGGPALIAGSVPGTGAGSVAGTLTFDPLKHLNRPALLLVNGHVYVAFGSHGDSEPWHGWVFGYDAATLQRTAIFNTTPTGWGGGIWQSGQGLVADSSGNIYFMTGNGAFDATTGGSNFGCAFVKLSTPQLTVADWFAPYDADVLNAGDGDLSSSGPVLIPGTNLIAGGGKESLIYVLDRNNMGHFRAGSNSQIVQEIFVSWWYHIHGAPVYWNGPQSSLMYVWTENNVLQSFRMLNGVSQGLGATSTMAVPDGMPGAMLALSANGSAPGTGILWASHPFSGDAELATVPGILRAFDASNVSVEIWNSRMNAARDDFGNLAKHTPPTVANGKVYVATFSNQVAVYGLIAPSPQITSVSPSRGPTAGGTSVTITGANFAAGAAVTVGGSAVTGLAVVNRTTITASTPAHASGPVSVTVANPDGRSGTLSASFTYVPPPQIVGVLPNSGPLAGGSRVTLSGANFAAGAGVTFDGVPATGVTVIDSATLVATSPAHAAGLVAVTVTNPDGQTSTVAAAFNYSGSGPAVTVILPATGTTAGGTQVTIGGVNFAIGAAVTFDGVNATNVAVADSSTLGATTPAHPAGQVAVAVTNPDGQNGTLAAGFSYIAPTPRIGAVLPASGTTAGGTAVTITGTGFSAGAQVSMGATAASGVSVLSDTAISATTAPHAAGPVSVTVTNPDGQSGSLASAFAYIAPPQVTGVAPGSGLLAGGTALTITGANFLTGAAVTVGGVAATSVVVVNGATITATTPANAPGPASVVVTNPDGQVSVPSGSFTYTADTTPPLITPALTGTLGLNGWYVGDVGLTWQVTDPESPISSPACAASVVTADTAGATFSCSATSAGGSASASVTLKRDASIPTAAATASPVANTAGWRRTAVTVSFTGTDSISGIASCSASVALRTEEVGQQSAPGVCTNGAGLASAAVRVSGINIDLTRPNVTVTSPVAGATYARNSVVPANFTCSDTLSGLAAANGCAGTVANGFAINTATAGSKNFSVTGRDAAGNTRTTTIRYYVQ